MGKNGSSPLNRRNIKGPAINTRQLLKAWMFYLNRSSEINVLYQNCDKIFTVLFVQFEGTLWKQTMVWFDLD